MTISNSRAAERLLGAIPWSNLHALDGDGEGVCRALRDLLKSESAESAQRAYWGVENHAFAQGELFQVSEACAWVLIAALVDPREKWVRVAVLDLMFQLASGHASSAPHTPHDILQRCHVVLREGLWLLFREAICGERDAALDVLDKLGEGEKARKLLSALPE